MTYYIFSCKCSTGTLLCSTALSCLSVWLRVAERKLSPLNGACMKAKSTMLSLFDELFVYTDWVT